SNGRSSITRSSAEAHCFRATRLPATPPRSIRSRHGCCWNGAMLPAASYASLISSKFRGKPVLVLTGTNDLGHARAVDEPIADWLNANGAEADFIYLGDLGIT